ncbi:methylase involved in ubiquinone/menaquinone biosynthesis [Desulfosporosinus orientis DSM 765]|uniref:Methylase involved in ubiquinone/menaquinone biosynthesis n=1 Tax=Desulfosporosinus orientis (strain ATCC 19365 / DSM 765 / NCIMB 8382 / VKM B-1628 / Singapore I) TaxID=768706 RepID=G7WDN6_DESOD|nr:methyltransferase domain-containing protein [Desulfosporosinus orientis]AET68361.1 methylase involved in ubiquinone/menaquinone biosynthesis [Desulfosporosinus orientis DSM 765]
MISESKRVDEMNYFELIAWLGIGSSHPGGFPATKQNLEVIAVQPEEYVLDAGCGSGLTACFLAKTVGCKILGVDINPHMIEKARLRAEKEGVTHLVEFRVADVNKLPFSDNHFDIIICESITVFLDKEKVYREFYRVLKPKGRIADLEMVILRDLPPQVRYQMEDCFGSSTNPLSFEEWMKVVAQAGFEEIEIINPQPLKNNSNVVFNELKKDWVLVKDLTTKIRRQPALLPRLQKNANFIKKNRSYYGFGLVYGLKPLPKKLGFKDWIRSRIMGRKL